jgi:hypothetical protein
MLRAEIIGVLFTYTSDHYVGPQPAYTNNTYTCPLYVTLDFSQHGGWVPRVNIKKVTGRDQKSQALICHLLLIKVVTMSAQVQRKQNRPPVDGGVANV